MSKEGMQLLLKVRLADQAERYDDMVKFLNDLVENHSGNFFDPSLLHHISVAYKNAVGERRASWRSVNAWEGSGEEEAAVMHAYLKTIATELLDICTQMLELINTHLLPKTKDRANEILLLKLKGDYFRYKAEVQTEEDKQGSVVSADAAYSEAMKKVRGVLRPCDPVRLELALNYSVLKFEMKEQEEACKMAKLAFEDAMDTVHKVDGDDYVNSTSTMQILRDNLVQTHKLACAIEPRAGMTSEGFVNFAASLAWRPGNEDFPNMWFTQEVHVYNTTTQGDRHYYYPNMALNEQERLLLKLKIAENTERYTDMLEVVKRLAREYPEYFIKEGQLKFLSIAYKNCVGHRRCSWRIINSLPEVTNERKKDITRRYLANIEDELTKFCTEIVEIIDKHLLQVATTMEVKVSLLKTKGDYCRYMAEIQTADKKAASVKNAEEFYKGAMSEVEKEMPPTHPEKLGLALNMSVFYYEIAENRHHACKLAKSAFDAAIADLDNMDETNYKSSTQILQLIRDNLTLWTSEDPDDSTD
ncbi:uncharacterized protein [Haliotis cracherodii]|uniref:uncharacterized protein n=2 Tax=Haliotis TaxID=6452 RepID=UPI0039E94DB4